MSQKELQRVKVIENAAGGRLSVREASHLLQLSERQVQRIKGRYQPDSIDWVRHGNRGRSLPWAISLPQRQLILNLARGKYQGFNDSHLTEKLCAEENLSVSRETVRRILRAAKLACPQKRRPHKYRSRRPPRPRFGMMALTDASRHDCDNKAKVELIVENDWRFRPPPQMAWNPNPSLHETHLGQTDSCMSRVSQFCPIDTFAFRCFMGPPQWGQCLGPAALNKFLCMSAPLATISKPK